MTDPASLSTSAVTDAASPEDVGAPGAALDTTFTLSWGRNFWDVNPRQRDHTLRELFEIFKVPDTKRGKLSAAEYHALRVDIPEEKKRRGLQKDGAYILGVKFDKSETRQAGDVAAVTAFICDFDNGVTNRAVIDEKLRGTAYLAYTSYSHTPVKPKLRVVIPYSKPITTQQHKAAFRYFDELFEGDLDPHCENPVQIYYTPACPHDATGAYECWIGDGELFEPGVALNAGETLPRKVASASEVVPLGKQPAQQISGHSTDKVKSLRRLEEALGYLDPDDRKNWIEVGLAIKHELGEQGREIWLSWSAGSPKFSEEDAQRTWESFKERGDDQTVITLASVFFRAGQSGWSQINGYIDSLNQDYFVAPLGSTYAIFREDRDLVTGMSRPVPMNKQSFLLLMANRKATMFDPNGQPYEIPLGPAWVKHRDRREYRGVVLDPALQDPDYYNLWKGFTVTPSAGSWRKMRWHILFVICSGNRRHYRYFLGWMAFCVQHPERRAEVALVLQGGRGAGKGMVLRTFGSLFGPHFVQVTQSSHLTGNFNSHLQRALLVYADEAFYAGDKQGEAALKGLITEPTIMIERKGFDAETQPNRIKLVVASNSEWVVPAGADERRYFVLQVSDMKKQDDAYFTALANEIEGGGAAAMLHDLKKRDLRTFNIRKPPNTEALKVQKLLSMAPIQSWFLDKLTDGGFLLTAEITSLQFAWGCVPAVVVYEDFARSTRQAGYSARSLQTQVGMQLRRLCPDGWPKTVQRNHRQYGTGVPHFLFPSLDECRRHFANQMGLDRYEWPAVGLANEVRCVIKVSAWATLEVGAQLGKWPTLGGPSRPSGPSGPSVEHRVM
jgi:hypothetical protein